MTDEQLHDELERRSKSASHSADWARHDLLPAVSTGIDTMRPQRVPTSRWPAIAGLAGAGAILLVLVVALPRVMPGTAGSPTPATSGEPSAISCAPLSNSGPGRASGTPSVVDETGLVESCEVWARQFPYDDSVAVLNPDGNLAVLEVRWSGTPCDLDSQFVFSETSNVYLLQGLRWQGGCVEPLARHAMRLHLRAPIDAASVTASLTDEPLTTPTPAPTTDPTQIQVLSPQTFATRLLAGDLTGQTVLVNGTIGEFEAIDGSVLCKEDGVTCLMGRLQRTDPEPVNIYGRPIDTTEDDPTAQPRADGGWPWVNKPAAPVTGTLVLSVQEDDTVEFLGASANGDRPALNAEATSQLSVDAVTSDEIYIVDAWLTASLIEPPCAAPDPGTFIMKLTNRWCGGPDWLVDEPVSVESGPPSGGLGVQSGAYRDFAPDPTLSGSVGEPRFGSYLVSPRLEGWCDDATPPCWQWDVVGRLSQAPDDGPIATPTLTPPPPTSNPLPAIECSPAPREVQWPADPTIRDTTGLIESCAALKPSLVADAIAVSNPDDDLRVLLVTWSGAPCDASPEFVFSASPTGFSLDGISIWDGPCIMPPPVSFEIRIHLDVDVDAQMVTPTWRQVLPEQPEMACTEVDWLEVPMFLTDETALVAGCEQTSPTMFPVDGALSIVANFGGPLTLQVLWRQPACFGPASLRFVRDTAGGYRLTIAPASGSAFTCVDGPSDYVRRGVVLHLRQPVGADSVSVVPQE